MIASAWNNKLELNIIANCVECIVVPHSTQFAVMFSSSLLVQCDATISSGNILLRATPETGVSGSTTYKIKREVM